MPAQAAARLIRGHRTRLARAVARQIQQLVPRYREMDPVALERNVATILSAVEPFLEEGDDARLLDITQNVIQLRAVSGFSLSEFLMAALCFLPVMRGFLVERSASVEEGLRVYETVESVALPLMGKVAELYQQTDRDLPPDPAAAFEQFFRAAGKFTPVRIERVVGDDEEG